MADPVVYLGTPYAAEPDQALDAYASRIGGIPTWFRAPPPPASHLQCIQCGGGLVLLAQVHAPLSVYDRVLYVMGCTACGVGASAQPPAPGTAGSSDAKPVARSGGGPVVVLRSQVYNPDYDAELAAAAPTSDEGQGMFEGGDDWGDDGDDWDAPAPAPKAAVERPAVYELCSTQPTVPKGVRKAALPMMLVDSFPEPRIGRAEEGKETTVAEAAEQVGNDEIFEAAGGDEETDDTAPADDFVERLKRCPSQVVRWCPGATPLRTSMAPELLASLPPCEQCGAARHYEMQVVAPAVYFLTKGRGEKEHGVHFAAIDIATCSKHCYHDGLPYVFEHARVQDEI